MMRTIISVLVICLILSFDVKGFQCDYSLRSRTSRTSKRNVLNSASARVINDNTREIQSKVKIGVKPNRFNGNNPKVLPKDDRYLLSDIRREMKHCMRDGDQSLVSVSLLKSASTMIIRSLSKKDSRWYDNSMLCSVIYECMCYMWQLDANVPRKIISSFISLILDSSIKSVQYLHIDNDAFKLQDISCDTLLFRLIQRSITLNGLEKETISENKEWNQILHYFISYPNFTLAKQIFHLQHISSNAPSLSAISYSILIKGCINHNQSINYIDHLYLHALNNLDVTIDTIMYNTILDAYVTLNSNNLQKALDLFQNIPSPNVRSYNTLLKGYAKFNYPLSEAFTLIDNMEKNNKVHMRDDITINTLVSIAISNQLYKDAEDVLLHWYYYNFNTRKRRRHPNIEAYTELIDAYIKSNQLQKGLHLFYIMQAERNVVPNEHTITVLVNGLAKIGNVKAVWKLIDYARYELKMERLSCIFFNAIFSGLLTNIGTDNIYEQTAQWSSLEEQKLNMILNNNTNPSSTEDVEKHNKQAYILHQIKQFYNYMVHYAKCKPNETTMQLIITTLAQSNELHSLSKYAIYNIQGLHPLQNIKIATTLLQGYITQGDCQVRDAFFLKLRQRDLIDSFVLNTYLDSLLYGKPDKDCMKHALQLFQSYRKHSNIMTFTIVISAFLKLEKDVAFDKAWKLYNCMKKDYDIQPDIIMYNCIFGIMQNSQTNSNYYPSQKRHFQFLQILLDDISPYLSDDEYKQRKVVLRKLLFQAFKSNESNPRAEDELFASKGWNKMDSNFPSFFANDEEVDDENSFLGSKKWNEVDSGFRII